ncbi:voltage-gated potassium channel [Methanolinea mesophila]|uniref:ion transporter n=1 Tax=Methanolinea mesophila TaxID=547055 RepID=UPI001AE4E449|nr:ion transporter [Methanolinea mesophila]MBP1928855.1 voltage-gated potassium channel [Methanolinea mesophila]
MTNTIRHEVYEILEGPHIGKGRGKWAAIFFSVLIAVNVGAAVLETDPTYFQEYFPFFSTLTIFSVGIFSLEYILRLWVCVENPAYAGSRWGRLRYAATPLALIDLVTLVPFYTVFFISNPDIAFLVRFSRILWILKLGHYTPALDTMAKVVRVKKEELSVAFFFLFLVLILSSSLMYYAEHAAQPTKFTSILASMWWGVETLSTVGYGDIVPVTPLGKLIGSVVAISGIALFALPAGILASGFVAELRKEKEEKQMGSGEIVCPNCGEVIKIEEVEGRK